MSFSLDTPTVTSMKAEARLLREDRATSGAAITHAAALEEIAHRHGYRDWNTAAAARPARAATPFQVGDRVRGTYLSQPFTGLLVGLELVHNLQRLKVIVQFDQPVDVIKFEGWSAFRKRVTATLDFSGVSPERTSDGEPHMRLVRN
jgi:hypothetical protein